MAIDDDIDGFGSEYDDDFSALSRSPCYPDIVQKVEELLEVSLAVEDEYQLISDCIHLLFEIEDKVIDYVSGIKKADFEVIKESNDQVLGLVTLRKRLLDFVDSKMVYLAPNLSAVVGTTVAAKLMATSGGLGLLGKMTTCNVQLLGFHRRNLNELSTQLRVGYLQESQIIQGFSSALKMGAYLVLAAACTTAARIDFMGKDPSGNIGKHLQEAVRKKIKRYCGAEAEPTQNVSNTSSSQAKDSRVGGILKNLVDRCV
ncbi:U4/U6 small nuclear ribonucleoprotein Prp31 homolog [Beta vulgaris subsp. vulgaris]|uniref:U4/U6 small nuclear ribonucleoprotein Prp31 homolog n=1 Tax=Beta vulgaris subsp. vulgaris TaxID=3555 RepID=UPI0020370998|nr:U4/U6 small nuclear ribonucleoprotein Prp31 homolog [Beta vulgaris subsp. vulgaris]